MSFWDLAKADADAVTNDADGPQFDATYTPSSGTPVDVRVFVDERQQIVQSASNGVTGQRIIAVSIPVNQVAAPQRSALLVFASGVFAGTWSLQSTESRTPAMSVALFRLEKLLAVAGDSARKVQ